MSASGGAGGEPAGFDGAAAIGLRRDERYMPELEAARGLAIALVVVYHAASMLLYVRVMPPEVPLQERLASALDLAVSPLSAYIYAGHTGVSLFFVLSAFLLSRPFLRELSGAPRVSRTSFYRRRALRIMPAYTVAVVVAVAATSQSPADWLRVIPYLTFLNSLPHVVEPIMPYSGVWWSLATEAQFYLVLPTMFALLWTRIGRVVVIAVLVVYAVAYTAVASGLVPLIVSMKADVVLRHSLVARAPVFAAGILAAWIDMRLSHPTPAFVPIVRAMQTVSASRFGAWIWSAAFLACGVAIGFLLEYVVELGYFEAEGRAQAWHVLEGLLWATFVLLLRVGHGPVRAALASVPLQWLGVISYSLYLVHYSVIYGLLSIPPIGTFLLDHDGLGPAGLFVVGSSVLGVLLSAVTYRLIERPFLRRKEAVGSALVTGDRPA